jgi:hypothetical protein
MITLHQFVERAVIPRISKKLSDFSQNIPYAVYDKNEETASIFKKVNPFLIEYKNTKYLFEGPTIQIEVNAHQSAGWIKQPEIKEKGYKHPFVHSDGSICFSDGYGSERWDDDKITFHKINPYQTLEFTNMICRAFIQTKELLIRGYYDPQNGTGIHPVRKLNETNFYLEKKRGELFWKK